MVKWMVNKKNLTDHVTADKMIGNCKEHIPNNFLHFSIKKNSQDADKTTITHWKSNKILMRMKRKLPLAYII